MVNQTIMYAVNTSLDNEKLDALAKEALNQQDYYIFTQRIGEWTLEEIGTELGKSRERIRQKERDIIQKLEKRREIKGFERQLIQEYGSLLTQINALKSKTKVIDDEEHKYEDQKLTEALQTKIDGLELSVRAYNCLKCARIDTIGDLVQKTEEDLLQYPGLGKGTLCELADFILEYGLNFGMNAEEIKKYKEWDMKYEVRKKDFDDVYQTADELFNKILNIDAGNLDLPTMSKTRIKNVFRAAGIKTIGDLVPKTELDLRQYPNLNMKGVGYLQDALKKYGLNLGMNVEKVGDKYVLKE